MLTKQPIALDPLMAERIKAAIDNGAADKSVQSRAHNPSWLFFGYSPFVGVYRQRKESDVAPWGYANRDLHLRTFFHLAGNEIVQSAESIMHEYVLATDYTIEGPDRTANRVKDLLASSDLGAGWETLLSKFLRDFDTTDNGVFIELIGEGDPDGELKGWPMGIAHLDSVRCRRTGDLEYPVLYYDSFGVEHKLHTSRVWYAADMPDTDERLLGYGQCALSRALSMAQTMISWSAMRNEWLDDKFPQGILTLNNVNLEYWETRLREHAAEQAAEERTTFSQVMPLPSMDPNQKVEVNLVPFRQIWEGFDQKVLFDLAVDMIAMAWGLDHQDLAPLTTGSMGSGAQSTVLDQKSKGKGRGRRLQLVERFINDITPPSVTFKFDQTDDAQDLQQANIRQAKSQTIISLYTAQKQQSAPPSADPMAAFLPTFQQTIGTDGLITRQEARDILVKEIPDWADILTPPPPDPEDAEGPDTTISGVLVQKEREWYGPRVRLYKSGKRVVIEPAPQRTQRKQAGRALVLPVSDAEIAAARQRLAEMGIDLDREAAQTFGETIGKAVRFDESKHPRADDGKFGHGSGSGKKPAAEDKPNKPESGGGLTAEQQAMFNSLTPEQRTRLFQSLGLQAPAAEKPSSPKPSVSNRNYQDYSTQPEEQLSQTYQPSAPKPTKDEKESLDYYRTNAGAYALNKSFRTQGGGSLTPQEKQRARQLDAVLNKSKLDNDSMLYRGMQGGGSRVKQFEEDVKAGRIKPGAVIKDHGYSSTTLDGKTAQDKFAEKGGVVFNIKAPKGSNGLYLNAATNKYGKRSDADIEFSSEKEVLLPRGSQLKINGLKKSPKGGYIVDAELLPYEGAPAFKSYDDNEQKTEDIEPSRDDRFAVEEYEIIGAPETESESDDAE